MKKKLSSAEIKKIEVEILSDIVSFCQRNQLRVYLSGGTLLGAIRHHGFIPWDDDIDVCMPRMDYEKFIRSFQSEKEYFQVQSLLTPNFSAPFAKVIDLRTSIKSEFSNRDIDQHLWVDVFPVDGLPESLEEVKKIYAKCNYYRNIYLLTDATLGKGKTKIRKYLKYILKPLANLYGKKRCCDKIEAIAKSYPYETCEYVGAITWGLYGAGERMLKSEFEKTVMVEFEGRQFPTFSCWDSYLKGLYKDYMQLPPVEKRRTHDMEVYLKE
ncbi:LicD family protein [Megasphaera sp.]|uniref:LicD family protein n=1 Tax=Megasphaera sp. TaxID=2023260 RepID=UPI002670A00E|nr:LicD family protein [uncultured Megasphaera sp.]